MDGISPDCAVCIYRDACERAQEGTFCPKFRSEEPPEYDEAKDPNVAWRQGEDVAF